MVDNAYYSQENHGPFELIDIGALDLEAGGSLAPCHLAVATFGTLNADKDNAILVPTWYSGTNKIIEQVYVGEGRALDPSKYFIVVVNQIGGGLSTSPHNWGGKASAFPEIRIVDDVVAQHRLMSEHFGIERIALVVGGSMGGQQAFEWAVRYPDMVQRAAAIAATAKSTPHLQVFLDSMADTFLSDPAFKGGDYASSSDVAEGMMRHARLWSVMGWSPEFYRHKRFATLGFEQVEDFVSGFMGGYFGPMDPAALMCMIRKARAADPGAQNKAGLAAALGTITARVLVLPIETDMFFKVADCEVEASHIPGGQVRTLKSTDGHLALFGADPEFLAQVDVELKGLLAMPAREAA